MPKKISKNYKTRNYKFLEADKGSIIILDTNLAHKAGLKILAIHTDNCWDTPSAIKNINNLISLKNVDYRCEVLNWNNFKRVQKIFIESGLPDIELPTDSAIQAVISRTAIKNGVKI